MISAFSLLDRFTEADRKLDFSAAPVLFCCRDFVGGCSCWRQLFGSGVRPVKLTQISMVVRPSARLGLRRAPGRIICMSAFMISSRQAAKLTLLHRHLPCHGRADVLI